MDRNLVIVITVFVTLTIALLTTTVIMVTYETGFLNGAYEVRFEMKKCLLQATHESICIDAMLKAPAPLK